jgi:Protein of unknown function (DUF3307)
VSSVVALVWVHFIADFLLQSDAMATRKSKSSKWLAIHVAIYSACLLPFGPWFAIINAALHFATDYITSRATSRLWAAQERHWFFVVIGLDQALHLTALLVTYEALR